VFSDKRIGLKKLAELLRLSYGKIAVGDNFFSTIPSAGALYPLHVYIFSLHTELKKGVYHYHFLNDWLDKIKEVPEMEDKIKESVFIENLTGIPACFICITANLKDVCAKYGERGYRFALLEGGHLAQNISLVAEYQGLKAVALGGYYDKKIAEMADFNYEEEKPIYIIALGN